MQNVGVDPQIDPPKTAECCETAADEGIGPYGVHLYAGVVLF
jgi:hypothetical protein